MFNIQPPLLGELNGFDLGGELDSSSEFMNFEDSYRRRRNQIDILEDRSEGELGANIELGESIGEIHPSLMHPGQIMGSKEPKNAKSKPRYGAYEGGAAKAKKDERPLAQTIDYEGGLENSTQSKHRASGMLRSSEDDLEKPIYDSKEDPIPKARKVGNGRGASHVFVSGESFGKNPLNRSSGHEKVRNARGVPNRDQIDEDFLAEDDDVQESGELDPGMFR